MELRHPQFDNINDAKGKTVIPAGRHIVDALAADKYGLAYAGIRYATPSVRPIAIAVREGAPYLEPTRENLINRTYPLLRDISIYLNRAPGKPIEPKVRELLTLHPESGGPAGNQPRRRLPPTGPRRRRTTAEASQVNEIVALLIAS